jgi:hypothetical protein
MNFFVHKDEQETALRSVNAATDKMNQALNLNVNIGSDTSFGLNYADVH